MSAIAGTPKKNMMLFSGRALPEKSIMFFFGVPAIALTVRCLLG